MMVALPIYMIGFSSWLIGFLTFTLFAGFVLSIVFQLAHTVEETAFPVPEGDTNKIENEWAIHQLQTTANFATRNKLISWLVGGLNFQIEHHLFPRSHIFTTRLSARSSKTCEDFNIRYIEYRKMRHAIISHASYLKRMGRVREFPFLNAAFCVFVLGENSCVMCYMLSLELTTSPHHHIT